MLQMSIMAHNLTDEQCRLIRVVIELITVDPHFETKEMDDLPEEETYLPWPELQFGDTFMYNDTEYMYANKDDTFLFAEGDVLTYDVGILKCNLPTTTNSKWFNSNDSTGITFLTIKGIPQ